MNKKLLLIILLLFPLVINAKCDYDAHEEYVKMSPNITYDNNYSKTNNKFTVVIYNIINGMYVKNGSKKYTPDEENTVTVSNINPGTDVMLYVYANDGCSEIKAIYIEGKYYNQYYGSAECNGYQDKIPVCSSQFTSSPVTSELVEEAIKNYNKEIEAPTKPVEEQKDNSLFARVKEFIEKWGIKILLVVITTFLTSTIFSNKFRKIKHGI